MCDFKRPTTREGWEALERENTEAADAAAGRNIKRGIDQLDPMDCALSYWADGLTAGLHRERAEICRNLGFATFRGLYQLQGGTWQRVRARMVTTRYGMRWLALAAVGRTVVKWLPVVLPDEKPPKIYRVLHLEVRDEQAPAWARIAGEGHGISGRAWVQTWRLDGGFPEHAVTLSLDPDAVEIQLPVEPPLGGKTGSQV